MLAHTDPIAKCAAPLPDEWSRQLADEKLSVPNELSGQRILAVTCSDGELCSEQKTQASMSLSTAKAPRQKKASTPANYADCQAAPDREGLLSTADKNKLQPEALEEMKFRSDLPVELNKATERASGSGRLLSVGPSFGTMRSDGAAADACNQDEHTYGRNQPAERGRHRQD